jgi:hypothetical protein
METTKLNFDTQLFDTEHLENIIYEFNENGVCLNDKIIVWKNDKQVKCEIRICQGSNKKWDYSYDFMVRKGHGGGGVSPAMIDGKFNTPQEAVLDALKTATTKYFNNVPAFSKELQLYADELELWIKNNIKNEVEEIPLDETLLGRAVIYAFNEVAKEKAAARTAIVDVEFEKRYKPSMDAILAETKPVINLGYRKNYQLKKKTQRQIDKLVALPTVERAHLLDAICAKFGLKTIEQTTLNL